MKAQPSTSTQIATNGARSDIRAYRSSSRKEPPMRRFLMVVALLIGLLSTCLSAGPVAAANQQANLSDAEVAEMLAMHNEFRRSVAQAESQRLGGTVVIPDLTWDSGLANMAQGWADQVIGLQNPPHSGQWVVAGENIYVGFGIGQSAAAAMEYWKGEQEFYHYSTNTCSAPPKKSCGHYTQLVWSTSTRVGCGRVLWSADNLNYATWVCNYQSPGNIIGQLPYSVGSVGGDALLFYKAAGDGAVDQMQADGSLVSLQSYPHFFTTGWTHIVSTPNGILFYNAVTGDGAVDQMLADGSLVSLQSYPHFFTLGWTHIVSTPNGILFYNAVTGDGAVDQMQADGSLVSLQSYPQFFTLGWTHIVSTPNGILFYNAATGDGAVDQMQADGSLVSLQSYPQFFTTGWTHIVSAPNGILFYNAVTGDGAVDQMLADGSLVSAQSYPQYFTTGWTLISPS
jgi:hypothetical protein